MSKNDNSSPFDLNAQVTSSVWIYPKKPLSPVLFGLSYSTVAILVVELCERWAYYGCSLLFVTYLNNFLGFSAADSTSINQGFTFWCYFSSILGAYVADSYLGRYKTILIFGIFYAIGLCFLTLSGSPLGYGNFPLDPNFALWGFMIAIFLIGVGTGGIKSNVGPLCAEQLVDADDESVERVFRYFYWMINAGTIAGQMVTPYLINFGGRKTNPDGSTIGTSYWVPFLYCNIGFFIGMAIFLTFSNHYMRRRPTGSIFKYVFQITKSAISNRSKKKKELALDHWVDYAEGFPSTLIAEVKQLFHILPIFLIFPIYWLLYNQMTNSFILQAEWLEKPSWIDSTSLNVIDAWVLIFFIPIHDRWVFPTLRRWGFRLGYVSRITTGFVIISTAFIEAFVIQYFIVQQGTLDANGNFTGTGKYLGRTTSDISIWWQVYAYIACGISEIWTSISIIEFAFSQAPESMRSMIMATNNCTLAIGSILGIILNPVFNPANYMYLFASFAIVMLVLS
eukprot:Sdes_comp23531_c0_seq1m21746